MTNFSLAQIRPAIKYHPSSHNNIVWQPNLHNCHLFQSIAILLFLHKPVRTYCMFNFEYLKWNGCRARGQQHMTRATHLNGVLKNRSCETWGGVYCLIIRIRYGAVGLSLLSSNSSNLANNKVFRFHWVNAVNLVLKS